MKVGFEDAFMGAQAECVTHCLDFVDKIDMIYIFIYQGSEMQMFNAFFKLNNTIKTIADLIPPSSLQTFFDIGIQNIENLLNICNQYRHRCPNEIKITYNVQNKSFDAQYSYQDYVVNNNIDPDEVIVNWIKEEKQNCLSFPHNA